MINKEERAAKIKERKIELDRLEHLKKEHARLTQENTLLITGENSSKEQTDTASNNYSD